MTTPWTPAPWVYEYVAEPEDGLPPDVVLDSDGFYIASIHSGLPNAESSDNARLIAAAPEMAELLDFIATDEPSRDHAAELARALLSRIRGEHA